MATPETLAEKHARILGALTEYGLNLAGKLHDQAMAAEEPKLTAELALAFHRVSRSLRQTLALETRLKRERAQLDEDGRNEARREERRQVEQVRSDVSKVLEREIWNEYEGEEAEDKVDDLQIRLLKDELAGVVSDDDVAAYIVRLRAAFGLPDPVGDTPASEAPPAPPWPPDLGGAVRGPP